MNVETIVKQIPTLIALLYKKIYLINKEEDIFYTIDYNGKELKVSIKKTYNDFINELNNNELLAEIENNNNLKKVIDNKIYDVIAVDNYKLVLEMDVEQKEEKDENKKMLLIADDSPIITKFFVKTFQDQYEILTAKDGNEAIKLIEENIDKPLLAAFLDLQMPVKNGYEVLEYMDQNNLFEKIPVSIISGEDTSDGIEKAMSYKVIDMLKKPFDANAAQTIVNRTISFSPKNK